MGAGAGAGVEAEVGVEVGVEKERELLWGWGFNSNSSSRRKESRPDFRREGWYMYLTLLHGECVKYYYYAHFLLD